MFGNILKDKVAFVTGGAIGIGEACVRQFAKEGAKSIIVDVNTDRAEAIVEDLGEDVVMFARTDVSNEESVRAAVKAAIDRFGHIDLAVNAAGITSLTGPTLVENIGLDDWDQMMGINLTGTFLVIKHLMEPMKAQGYGRIVNISSTAALGAGYRGASPYAASKAGMVGLTYMIAREGGPHGITCNAIGPGPTKTPTRKILVEREEEMVKTIPVGFLAEADDIANAALFLCSDAARFVTGQMLFVDGGATIPWDIDHIITPQ
ncbi:MAG: SDR family NAD(P)-dependent oxidoreductase [Rhodospirillales bacterium]|jgi:NAD(P)-dependent dehydrogenase (short-subunit alcohol dehydrogenase family)|nr:SDR family NAD(P)-dependent oxidoreductase [Rhodospirillales bacterium]